MSDYNYLFKFVLVGEAFVGKSCLMTRFVDDRFEQSTEPTIGVEFGTRTIPISNNMVKIQIWDTAGQENYHSITRSYFKGSANQRNRAHCSLRSHQPRKLHSLPQLDRGCSSGNESQQCRNFGGEQM